MNRHQEYLSLINITKQSQPQEYKTLFYDTIYEDIIKINRSITPTLNYKNILVLEKSLNKTTENINQTLGVIEIEGTKDEVVHFEGVKKIIQTNILKTKLRLEKLKLKKSSYNFELEPEKPKSYKINNNIQMENLQIESREIMGNSLVERYRVTRQRLLEIESIQENISEQLNIQDERIDDVISKVGDIYKSVKASKNTFEEGKGPGSFFRRVIAILFFCLAFILAFLHMYYKRKGF